MSRHALIAQLAVKVGDEALLKFAADNLSIEDIQELSKAALDFSTDSLKDMAASAAGTVSGHVGDALGRAGTGLQNLGASAAAHPNITTGLVGAGGVGTLALLAYLAHKALKGSPSQHETGSFGDMGMGNDMMGDPSKMASVGLTPGVVARLDRLAADPSVKLAFQVLSEKGVL